MRSLNRYNNTHYEILNLVGKGVNSYTAKEKEFILHFVETLSSNKLNSSNIAIFDRVQFGERLDVINQDKIKNIFLSGVPQDEPFLARVKITPSNADRFSIDTDHPKLISKHFLVCKVKNDNIYYHFFTSTPRKETLYRDFHDFDLINREKGQSISKYQGVLEGIYISDIEVLDRQNTSNIDVDSILGIVNQGNYFADNIHYNNKYYALLADEIRLSKVKKNIETIYPINE